MANLLLGYLNYKHIINQLDSVMGFNCEVYVNLVEYLFLE